MCSRERLTSGFGGFVVVVVLAVGLVSGCSSGNPHDINLGTDVGANFVPPDSSAGDASYEVSDAAIEVAADDAPGNPSAAGDLANGSSLTSDSSPASPTLPPIARNTRNTRNTRKTRNTGNIR